METLLIVDGHNLLFQMFYGMPSRIFNKSGKAIHATLGFVGALIKLIKMINPDNIVVLFDSEKPNERCNLLPEYKANRVDYSTVEESENPFSQLSDIFSCLDVMKIKHIEVKEYETDDVVAAYCLKYKDEMNIVISSFDSDFFQLIDSNVKVLRYRGDKTVICDEDYIINKFGVLPKQYAYYKSLVGDSADNIKGAEKIGVKTAALLVNQFNSISEIILNVESIKKQSVKQSIKNNKERLILNLQLIKLNDKAAIPYDITALKYKYDGDTTTQILRLAGVN